MQPQDYELSKSTEVFLKEFIAKYEKEDNFSETQHLITLLSKLPGGIKLSELRQMWIDHQQEISKDGNVVEVDVLVDRLREWDMLASEQKQDTVMVRGEMPEDELIILKIKQPKREKDKLEEDTTTKICNVIANFYNEMLSEACQAYKTSWSKIFPYMSKSK